MEPKIGIIYNSPFPNKFGYTAADKRVREIAKGLSLASNSIIEVFVPKNHDMGQNADSPLFKVRYFGKKENNLKSRYYFWKKLIDYVKQEKFSALIFYNTNLDSFIPQKILRRNGIKVILETCDFYSSFESNIPKKIIFLLKEYLNPKETDGNLVISKFLENKVKNSNKFSPILRIPVIVDIEKLGIEKSKGDIFRQKYNIDKNKIILAFTGSSYKHEGLYYLLEAISLIKNLEFVLIITGKEVKNDPKRDVVSDLVKKFEIDEKVIQTGWISDEGVSQVLSAADILVLPQTNHLFSVAGLPTKLAEYASSNKALLVTNVGDVSDYFKNEYDALFCEPSNSHEMAQKLITLIENENFRNTLASNSFKIAKSSFDYKVVSKNILQFIKSI